MEADRKLKSLYDFRVDSRPLSLGELNRYQGLSDDQKRAFWGHEAKLVIFKPEIPRKPLLETLIDMGSYQCRSSGAHEESQNWIENVSVVEEVPGRTTLSFDLRTTGSYYDIEDRRTPVNDTKKVLLKVTKDGNAYSHNLEYPN